MVLADPKAEFSRAVASMAKSLLPGAAPKQQQRKRSFAFGRS
jgi:hypothetical protein